MHVSTELSKEKFQILMYFMVVFIIFVITGKIFTLFKSNEHAKSDAPTINKSLHKFACLAYKIALQATHLFEYIITMQS